MAVDIHEALMVHLLAQAGLTALVGTRIRYDERDQEDTLPAIAIIDVSDVKEHLLAGQSKLERPRIQLTAYATTRAGARAVADQIKAALNDYHGTLSGVVVQKIELQLEMSGQVTTPDGTVHIHATDLEYEVNFVKE